MKLKHMLAASLALAASILSAATTRVPMLAGEHWWGCANYFGAQMPFTAETQLTIDLTRENYYNQYASLMTSDKGRVIWCDVQCRFEIAKGEIVVRPTPEEAPVKVTEAGKTLRDAFCFASRTYFPPSGKTPDLLFFTAPQYNTWIELTYNQNEKDILAYAQSMLDHGLPPGILMIDDTWQLDYGTWEFDPRRFSDPKGMVEKLHKMGFKVILWMCPWVSMDSPAYRLLAHGRDPNTCVRQPIGGLYRDAKGRPVPVTWWNGVSAMLDFTDPIGCNWFKAQLDRLVRDYGVDGFKLDGGAVSRYVGLQPHAKGVSTAQQANGFAAFAMKYPICEYRHAWQLGGQPIVERLHDKDPTWKDVRALVSDLMAGGLLGHSFMCPDMIGGGEWSKFLPGTPFDTEVYVRSAQVHALCGQMQFSASPWRVLDVADQKAIVNLVKLRQEKFAQKFAALAQECAITGEPMIRNLEYVYPGCGYAEIKDQFMMGDFLMVAPAMEKGMSERKVVIPKGTWRSDDGQVVEGPCTITVKTPRHRLPHFTPEPRCAVVMPWQMKKQNRPSAGAAEEVANLAMQMLDGLGVAYEKLSDGEIPESRLTHKKVVFVVKFETLPDKVQAVLDRFVARGGIVVRVRHHELFIRKLFMRQMKQDAAGDWAFWKDVFRRNLDLREQELKFVKAMPVVPGEMHRTSLHDHPWRPVINGKEMSFDEAVGYLKSLGFNSLGSWSHAPNVAHYRSKVLPVDPAVETKGDMLDEMVAACRKHGVKAYASLRCCITQGKQNFGDFQKWVDEDGRAGVRKDGSVDKSFLCPAHPANRKLLVDAAVEMAAKGVDGVDLDYIRYKDPSFCHCARCRQGVAEHGGNIDAYRKQTILTLVREIRAALKATHPGVKLGVSPFPTPDAEGGERGQGWDVWCHEGLLDEVYPMNYWRSPESLYKLYVRQRAYCGNVPSYPCIGPILWADDCHREIRTARIIEKIRAAGLPGFSYFTINPREMELLGILSEGPLKLAQ